MNYIEIRKRRIISIVSLIFSTFSALAGSGFLVLAHNTIDKINYKSLEPVKNEGIKEEQELGETCLDIDDSRLLTDPMILNILIFGTDKNNNEDENGRSDSIILMSIDSRHKKLKLTSFMRDLWVEIPGYSYDKLNHAYSYGKESLSKITIEKNFGIKIDRCISIDFEGFKEVIKILGGVNMNLTAGEVAYINKWSRDNNFLDVSDGTKRLSPKQALCHVRNRTLFKKDSNYPDDQELSDDYARASRQRDFFKTVFSELKNCNLNQVLDIISKIGPQVTTNFRKSEILKQIPKTLTYLKYPLTEYATPEIEDYLDTYKTRGEAVLEIQDIKRLRYKLAKFIYEDSVKERPDILRGDYKKRHISSSDYEFPTNEKRKKRIYSEEKETEILEDDLTTDDTLNNKANEEMSGEQQQSTVEESEQNEE